MKRIQFLVMGIALVLSVRASEISDSQAAAAVQAWIDESATMGRKSKGVASCETVSTASGTLLHVVNLQGGGFAVTPADDRIEPIIAFVPSGGKLVKSDENPFWVLLSGDIEARERAACVSSGAKGGSRTILGASASGGTPARAQARWAELLGRPHAANNKRALFAAAAPDAPADIVVDSFVESRWSQDVHNNYGEDYGDNCFNYYTPQNYPCGCVVSAGSQIMRYWQWPKASVAARTFACKVDDKPVSCKMIGGTYDWSSMPLVPANGVAEENCRAIGKLAYDLGVSIGMNWAPQNSVANLYSLVPRLKDTFGYANAVAAVYMEGHYTYSLDELKKVVIPNCDARAPVAMAISGDGGHAAVIDGYGYSGEDFYMHVNFGWAGLYDAWYLPPNILDFDTIDGLVFNIFPQSAGSILSGRVFDAVDTPIKDAVVTLRRGAKTVATTTTDGNGVYAFVADADRYSVTASVGESSHSINVVLAQTTGTRLDENGLYYNSAASIGNSFGNDIQLAGVEGVAQPEFSHDSCLFYPSISVAITCPESGATIRYTLDGSDPTDSSPFYLGPIVVEDNVTIRARAWKADKNPSAVVSAKYTYDASKTTLLRGDRFAYPFVIYGAGNSLTIEDNSNYAPGNEQGEPTHVPGHHQYRTIWYKWKAPGTGKVTFTVNHENSEYLLPPSIAVYSGSSLTGLAATKLACSANPLTGSDATVTVDVEQDREYRIVGMSQYGDYTGIFQLEWSGSLVPGVPFVVVGEDDEPHGFPSIDEAVVAANKTYHSQYKYILVNEDLRFVPPSGIRFKPNTGVTITARPLSQEYLEPRPVPVGDDGAVVYEIDNRPTTYRWTGAAGSSWNDAGNWAYEENGSQATATRQPGATDTVVFENGAAATISIATEVDSLLLRLADKDDGVVFAFNSRGTSDETRASLSCSRIVFPAGTMSIAFSSTSYALFDGARLVSWSGEAPSGEFAFAAQQDGFELAVDDRGLVAVEKTTPKATQTAVVGGYAWTFAVDGQNAMICNNGARAVDPAPTGHVDIPSRLGNCVVAEIGDMAFAGCDAMSSVTMPDGVKLIGRLAFAGCAALQCVDVGKGVSDSGDGTVNIKAGAFSDCGMLMAAVFRGASEPVVRAGDIFYGTPEDCTVYVPKSAKKWLRETWFGKPVVHGDYMVDVRVAAKQGKQFACKSLAGSGSYALGKNATLKATPNSGYVFAGWYDGRTNELLSRAASFAYVVTGEAAEFAADFVLLREDEAKLGTTLSGMAFSTSDDGSFELQVDDYVSTYSEFKASFKNLPAGLKYDDKTCKITGKATKPGVYKVEIGLANAAVKKARNSEFTIVVPNLTSELFPELKPDNDAYGVVSCGVALPTDLVKCMPSENGWTVKVAGLPSGLKFTAKDIMKKGSKTEVEIPANTIYGIATKAGTYTVTFTASKKGEANHVATITLNVEELPTWATGTFTGSVKCIVESVKLEEELGSATMTVAANGKVSGKIALDGTNWAFKADSFSRAVESSSSEVGSPQSFVVEVVATAGKAARDLVLEVAACDGGRGATALPNGVVEGTFGEGEVKMWRNVWKDKSTAAAAKAALSGFEGVYTVSIADGADYGSGYLSLAVGKNGDAKATGKLADGTGVSAASPLMYDEDAGWFVMLYAAPSAYKGGAFAAAVGFEESVAGRPTYRLAPVIFTPQWTSRNPEATGGYGEGFDRPVELSGAYYNKLETLRRYYESMRLDFCGGAGDGATSDVPELDFTFKKTYFDEQGRKVTASSASTAQAVDTLGQDGMTVTVGNDGRLVIDKASKPEQDKVTKEWRYNGPNDGGLTLSFTQATGIFKGAYTFWYDYVSAVDETTDKDALSHTSKKVSFEGILVQGEEPRIGGFYLWDATGEYKDEKTGKPKAYKYKQSFSVTFE